MGVFETVFDWETKRLFEKWSLTEGGRLREVVAMRELTVMVSSVNRANALNETECKADHRAKGLIFWRPDISFNRISGLNQGQSYT